MNTDIYESLKSFFRVHHQGLELVYLFGSQVTKKTARNNPDVDIALLFEEAIRQSDWINFEKELWHKLTEHLSRSDVDIILMDRVGPILRHEVLRSSVLLYAKTKEIKADWETRWLNEWWDFEPYRKIFQEGMYRRWGLPYNEKFLFQ